MRFFLFLAILLVTTATNAAEGCILAMNGSWSLNPAKSLDPTSLAYEVLIFSNTASEQRYLMEFENSPNDRGSLEWSVPCDGQDHPSPDFLGALLQTQLSQLKIRRKIRVRCSKRRWSTYNDVHTSFSRQRPNYDFSWARCQQQSNLGPDFRQRKTRNG